jgi:tRNA-Thr(GGU) m(6)t(6)A37 methyltransferase TsaA
MNIQLTPIAHVRNTRKSATDDFWGNIISEIELAENIPTASLAGISDFSHLEIIFHFDKIDFSKIKFSGHPRGNPEFPLMGIFAQRKKDRPNAIGLCTVELLEHNDRILKVKNLDAIDGTPILDIKPVFKEFLPQGEIHQPKWVSELMRDYWLRGSDK